MAATITTFSGDKRVSYQSVVITGSTTDLDTGLNTVENVIATVKDSNQAAADGAYVTCNFAGNTGLVDLYNWDDAGNAAVNNTTVLISVIGT